MEEEKAAAYYDELSRKGEGAARFKQGLGFSSTSSSNRSDAVPARGSALPSSSSFLSNFVRASSPAKAAEYQKEAQLDTIHNKLKKKKPNTSEIQKSTRVSRESRKRSSSREADNRHSRRRSRSRSRDGRASRYRRRSATASRDKYRYTDSDRDRERRRRRSRSRSDSDEDRRRKRDRKRSRSVSPRDRRLEKRGGDRDRDRGVGKAGKERNGAIDYAKLIEGYDKMSAAERVKAKVKLQLSETAKKDATKGMSGWERFDFDKDAPLDDEDIEAVDDDAALVKRIGQSFRFAAVETRREEQIKAAHDEAMFGASSIPPSINSEDELEQENTENGSKETSAATSLMSEKVIAKQQGSWRDRARRV